MTDGECKYERQDGLTQQDTPCGAFRTRADFWAIDLICF